MRIPNTCRVFGRKRLGLSQLVAMIGLKGTFLIHLSPFEFRDDSVTHKFALSAEIHVLLGELDVVLS